jgi:hypothetical protein
MESPQNGFEIDRVFWLDEAGGEPIALAAFSVAIAVDALTQSRGFP